MTSLSFPVLATWSVANAFAVSALVHLAGLRKLRVAYADWGYPRNFHRVVGGSNLIASAFLATPQTRIWGVALAGMILFIAVVTLLNHGRYAYAVPGMVLMAALPQAILASTV